jgi:APA family basic amino acid/polyamine antiporter
VIAVYVGVNIICVRVLGPDGLAQTTAPASAVMRLALGERGARLIAAGIAVSTLGFLSQSMLTAPRVYYAMAADGVFFRAVAKIHPKTQVPIVAIALQGIVAVVITLSGTYEQILGYVVSTDFIFFGLTGLALFVFRRRQPPGEFRTPGHPVTTAVFVLACWVIVVATVIRSPVDSAIGFGILAAGLVAYRLWSAGVSARTDRPSRPIAP